MCDKHSNSFSPFKNKQRSAQSFISNVQNDTCNNSLFEPKPADGSHQKGSSSITTKNETDSETKQRHLKIVKEYHTKNCAAVKLNKCPFDFFKCFDSHESNYLRRKLQKRISGWNYSSEMCQQILNFSSCSLGRKCPYAHTNDEKFYHPNKFKKSICNFYTSNTICPRNNNCFKAHGKEDISYLSNEDFALHKNSASNGSSDSKFAANSVSEEKLELSIPQADFLKMTVHNATKDPNFYMFEYKTKPCLNVPCNNMRCCTNYHHEQERRRSPRDFRYSAEPCPSVKLSTKSTSSFKWREPSRCDKLVLCEKSHTLLEQMYHPHIYKTSLCSNYSDATGKDKVRPNCLWGNLCTHAHGKSDLRSRSDQTKVFVYEKPSSPALAKNKSSAGNKEINTHPKRAAKPAEINKTQKKTSIKPVTAIDKKEPPAAIKNMSFSDALRAGAHIAPKQNDESSISKNEPSVTLLNLKLGQDTLKDKNTPEIPRLSRPKTPNAKFGGEFQSSVPSVLNSKDRKGKMPKIGAEMAKEKRGMERKKRVIKPGVNVILPKTEVDDAKKEGIRKTKIMGGKDTKDKIAIKKKSPSQNLALGHDNLADELSQKLSKCSLGEKSTKEEKDRKEGVAKIWDTEHKNLEKVVSKNVILSPLKRESLEEKEPNESEKREILGANSPPLKRNDRRKFVSIDSAIDNSRPMNVKKYFSPVIGPNNTAIFDEKSPAEKSGKNAGNEKFGGNLNEPKNNPILKPEKTLLQNKIETIFKNKAENKARKEKKLNSNLKDVELKQETRSVELKLDPPEKDSFSEKFPGLKTLSAGTSEGLWAFSQKREDSLSPFESPEEELSELEEYYREWEEGGCSLMPYAHQPLRIVQDSPMYELYGDRGEQNLKGIVIDYKQLFESLKKRNFCPSCGTGDIVRDRALIPCGHFFCIECVSKLELELGGKMAEEARCPYCEKKCESILKLEFD